MAASGKQVHHCSGPETKNIISYLLSLAGFKTIFNTKYYFLKMCIMRSNWVINYLKNWHTAGKIQSSI